MLMFVVSAAYEGHVRLYGSTEAGSHVHGLCFYQKQSGSPWTMLPIDYEAQGDYFCHIDKCAYGRPL